MSETQTISIYIENNYLTLEQLAEQTKLSLSELENLLHHQCIPKHSHTLTKQVIYHTDIFGSHTTEEQKTFYYHPSLVQFAKKAQAYFLETVDYTLVANKMHADFSKALEQALSEINDATLQAQGAQQIIQENWPYVLDGTYGVCLKEISAKNILLKKHAVAVLEQWKNAQDKSLLQQKAETAATIYNQVAAHFGPHEIMKSTREKFYNHFIREKTFSD